MGEIKKIGDEYFIEFFARGLKYQQRGGKKREDAEALLKEVETKIARGEEALIVRDVDLDIFFLDFLEQARREHTARTVSRYQKIAEDFKKFMSGAGIRDLKLSQVTPRVIEQYRSCLMRQAGAARGGRKPRAVNFTILLLSDVLQHGIKLGYIHDDPTVHIKLLPMRSLKKPPVLNEERRERFWGLLPPGSRSMAVVMLATGMRLSEIVDLRFGQIDWGRSVIMAEAGRLDSKYGRPRAIPMTAGVLEILKSMKNAAGEKEFVFCSETGGKIDRVTERTIFLSALRECCHDAPPRLAWLRHTFAHDLLRRGMKLSALYKLLGFADIAMAVPYLVFRYEYLNEAIGI